jgi:hypothetical protein
MLCLWLKPVVVLDYTNSLDFSMDDLFILLGFLSIMLGYLAAGAAIAEKISGRSDHRFSHLPDGMRRTSRRCP